MPSPETRPRLTPDEKIRKTADQVILFSVGVMELSSAFLSAADVVEAARRYFDEPCSAATVTNAIDAYDKKLDAATFTAACATWMRGEGARDARTALLDEIEQWADLQTAMDRVVIVGTLRAKIADLRKQT